MSLKYVILSFPAPPISCVLLLCGFFTNNLVFDFLMKSVYEEEKDRLYEQEVLYYIPSNSQLICIHTEQDH